MRLNGQPVTNARICFEDAAAGNGGCFDLDAAGKFVVASPEGAGLPPGKYQVAIRSGASSGTERGEVPGEFLAGSAAAKTATEIDSPIPNKYRHVATSGLSYEIRAGRNPDWNVELRPEEAAPE